MYYITKTNKYGLEVVTDVTTDANFAKTSGLNYVQTTDNPNKGDYVYEGNFISVDSDNYSIIADIIKIKEAERTAQEGIVIPEPQPEGEVNPDPDPSEQVIPDLEVPSIPITSNGEVPEDGKIYFDEGEIDSELPKLKEAVDWSTELLARAKTASVDPDNAKRVIFDPPVTVDGIDAELSEVIIIEDDLDGYIQTLTGANEKAIEAYNRAVEIAAQQTS